MSKRDERLEIKVSEGLVTIAAGVRFLSQVCLVDDGRLTITDEEEFASAFETALQFEEEDGTTIVHKMFDEAFNWCLEQGQEGVELVDHSGGEEP